MSKSSDWPGSGQTHRLVSVPGGRIHLVEQGSGPLVLLVHGFPESWYSWRHQLPALAAAGYRAVAIDVRGYGRSSKPAEVEAYRMLAHVADNVAVVQALGEQRAIVVGHDWGSQIAANSALLRPDVFSAVALMSVPYAPRGGPRPTELFGQIGGDDEFYVSYFQQPGRAEREIEPDVRDWLAGFYAGLSADTMPGDGDGSLYFVPPGRAMRDRFGVGDGAGASGGGEASGGDGTSDGGEASGNSGAGNNALALPSWLSETDLDVYAGEFERTGLTGALNRYRNVDRDWEDLAAWDGATIHQPSLFIAGARDASTTWMAEAIQQHAATLPGLSANHLLDGCGHWVQQERADEVNRLLIDWLGDQGR